MSSAVSTRTHDILMGAGVLLMIVIAALGSALSYTLEIKAALAALSLSVWAIHLAHPEAGGDRA